MARRIPNSELFDAIWSWAWDERLCPSGTINVLPIDFATEDQEPQNGVATPAIKDEEEQSFGSEPATPEPVKVPKVLRKKAWSNRE